jgi:hypothetical protein
MATNSGNNGTASSTTPHEQQVMTQLAAVATEAAGAAVIDFLARVEHAVELLATVGRELGSAGAQDERELIACAEQYRTDMQRIVEKIITRHRRRVGDLERVLGKLAG